MVATRDNGSDPPTLLDMSNLVAIFGLIDVTQRGRYTEKYDIYSTIAFEFKHLFNFIGYLLSRNTSPPCTTEKTVITLKYL